MATAVVSRYAARATIRTVPTISHSAPRQMLGAVKHQHVPFMLNASRSISMSWYRGAAVSPEKQQVVTEKSNPATSQAPPASETSSTVVTPPNNEPTSRLGKLYKQSKELVIFYKNGIQLLWNNNKTAKALKRKVAEEGYVLDRNQFQLIHHSRKDMIKLIPFGIIFCILPESIPLWVIFLPGIVPSTCLKESQLLKQREKLDKVRQNMAMNAIKSAEQVEGISPEDFLSVHNFTRIAKHYNHDFELSRIDRRHLSAYCRFMGLQGWGTQGILKNRLAKHMNYLLQDDNLLAAEGVDSLGLAELQAAAEERGIRSIGATEDHLRRALKYWITLHRAEPPISPGLLVFSRMFLLNANYDKTKI